jgi:hypothetical protein
MDVADHHVRRYEKRELEEKLRSAGFQITRCHFVNFIGMFGWFLSGRILKRQIIPLRALKFYDKMIVPLVEPLEKRWHPPVGQSLFAVGIKRTRPKPT